jgi:transcriptional regulator with XRE-family HTH domain
VVAGTLGITEASYSRWEAGQVPLRVSDLESLRALFGVGWGTFFDALGMTPERDYQPVKDWLADRQIERLAQMEGNTSHAGGGSTPEDALSHVRDAPTRRGSGRFLPSFAAAQPVLA